MANIDNLNFEVILKDEEFKKKVDENMELAKKLNTSLSTLLDVQNKIKQSGIKVTAKGTNDAIRQEKLARAIASRAAAEERLAIAQNDRRGSEERLARDAANRANAEARAARAAQQTEEAQRRTTTSVNRTTRAYQQQSKVLSSLKGALASYFSIQGASRLVSSLVRVTGEFELQKTTLAAMLGDLNQAENILTKIKGLAVESPFQFKELATYTKQLSAFAVPAEELYNTTKMLADISAGLGVGMDRIVLAYGQVRSAAFLRGQEVRQFTEAGIPILDELAKQFTGLEGRVVSTTEVFDKISSRLVPFEMVAKVFKDMTSEGGKFYNMQEVQAETLRGKLSNLKDAYEMMLNEIGEGQTERLKDVVDWTRKLLQNYEDTGKALFELIVAYGVYKTALAGLTLATGTFDLANHKLLSTISKTASWVAKNPFVLLAAGLTAVGYAIYKSQTALESYEKVQNSLNKTNASFSKATNAEIAKLNTLYAKLELAKEGTEEYEGAKKRIYSQYATYISELQNEGIAVNNLADIYDNLKKKVEESQKARFRGLATQNLTNTYEEETDALLDEASRATDRLTKKVAIKFDALQKEAVQAYVAGTLSMEDLKGDKRLKAVADVLELAAKSGNKAWEQFATSIEDARKQFNLSTEAYSEGLKAIESIYGEAQETTSEGLNPFVYGLGEEDESAKKAIEAQIRSIQKLADAYDKLKPFMNDNQLKSTLSALFPNINSAVIESFNFTAELERLASELERFDEEAAKNLRETISKDVAGSIANSFKAVEEYRKSLDKWLSEDFDISGEGIAFDISKIISDLKSEYAKIDEKRMKNLQLLADAQKGDEEALRKVREVYGEEAWHTYKTQGKSAIEELARAEREAAKKTADEKIRDLASKYVSEKLAEKNIDTTNLEDKTIAQVKTQISRLNGLVKQVNTERGNILAEMVNGNIVEGQEASWEMLSKVVEMLGIKIADLGEEVQKKTLDVTLESINAVGDLGNELSSLGENLELTGFAQIGKEISRTSEELSSLMKVIEAEDTVGVIANVVSMFVTRLGDLFTYAYEQQIALNDASRAYIELQNEMRENSYSGIFGTDELGLAIERQKILEEAQERYNTTLEEFNRVRFQSTSAGAGNRTFNKASLAGVMSDISSSQGWDLYKDNGEINIAALESYFDAYSNRLTRKQKKLIQNLIEDGNAVTSAAEKQAEYLRDLFSKTADDIADSFIEAFKESGEAALDYGDLMNDIATNMAKSVIKQMLLQSVFSDEIAKQAGEKLASGDTSAALATVEEAFKAAEALTPQIQGFLEGLKPYLQMKQPEEAQTLGEGIKGITEDTANLLASYLNAMRSDVSQMRTLQAEHLPIISAAMPTILDHLAQINAHAFDTAQHTQSMLSELISINSKFGDVIGSGSDGSAIKVLM